MTFNVWYGWCAYMLKIFSTCTTQRYTTCMGFTASSEKGTAVGKELWCPAADRIIHGRIIECRYRRLVLSPRYWYCGEVITASNRCEKLKRIRIVGSDEEQSNVIKIKKVLRMYHLLLVAKQPLVKVRIRHEDIWRKWRAQNHKKIS